MYVCTQNFLKLEQAALTLGTRWEKDDDDDLMFYIIFIPRHTKVAGYYGFTLDVCPFFVSG